MLQRFFRLIAHGRLTVLLFHKVPLQAHALEPADLDLAGFERVLRSALRLFRVLPLDEAVQALRAGNLPPRAACITFDDGYPDWLGGVVPVLQRLGAHATFFVTTGPFLGQPLWNERIVHALHALPPGAQPLRAIAGPSPVPVGSVQERQQAVQRLAAAFKYLPPHAREAALQALEAACAHPSARVPVMPVEHLRELHALGFGIGGHSVSHPILSRCTPAQAMEEIGAARETLTALIRAPVTAFAYPNGRPGRDFGPEHVAMVARAGYRLALTTHRGAADAQTSLLQLPRFSPWGPSARRMALQFARNFHQPSGTLPEPPAPQQHRVLMVAFHFPPQAGSSGILRTLNFVK
jgi:peptidoglycan/xylan/chitin deacetylase (PgdA/CDA1 family)